MVFLPSRTSPQNDESDSYAGSLSRGARAIIDLLDVVGNVRDGDHLQCVAFLAQEFGLLTEPLFLFGSSGPDPRRPHSVLLESHFYALLRDGIVDLDGAGRLRLRRDLFPVSSSGLAGRRLAALGALSPGEAAIFAAAVLRLAGEGRHAGSLRHDDAFGDTITRLSLAIEGASEHDRSLDVAAICDVRYRLMPAEPVMLTPA